MKIFLLFMSFVLYCESLFPEVVRGDNSNVNIDVMLVANEKGLQLEPSQKGYVFLAINNNNSNTVNIPLIFEYGKGGNGNIKPSYINENYNYYAGFEIANIILKFANRENSATCQIKAVCMPFAITVDPKETQYVCLPIIGPEKEGIYDIIVEIDNTNLEKAIYSYNMIDPTVKYLIFNKTIIIKDIKIQKGEIVPKE